MLHSGHTLPSHCNSHPSFRNFAMTACVTSTRGRPRRVYSCGAWPDPPGSLGFSGPHRLFGLSGFYGFYGFRGLTPPKPPKPRKPIKPVKPKKPMKPTGPTEPVGSRYALAGDLVGFIPVGPGRTLRGRLGFLGPTGFLGFLGFMGFMGFGA